MQKRMTEWQCSISSLMSAAFGIGGGTIMLAVLAQVLPVKAIIPVHGVIQIGSNLGRAAALASQVRWQYLLWFFLGCLIGAVVGGKVVISLADNIPRIILGCFILYSVWGPKFTSRSKDSRTIAIGGFVSTLLTMFVGATGPFILALLKALELPRVALVATNAACMVLQHSLKVIVFGLLGFAYGPYLSLILLMIISGFIGTLIGKRVLLKINEDKFRLVINVLLSVLAIRLLISAVI